MSQSLAEILSGMIIVNEVHGMARGGEVTGMAIYFSDQYQALGDDLLQYSNLASNRPAPGQVRRPPGLKSPRCSQSLSFGDAP